MVRLLEQAVGRSPRPVGALEAALGVAPGYLGELFAGRVALEVRHVLLLARELGLDPALLFEGSLSRAPAVAGAPGDPALTEIEGAFRQLQGGRDAARSGEPALELDAVKELIRATIREELARMAKPPTRGPRSPGERYSNVAGPADAADPDEPLP